MPQESLQTQLKLDSKYASARQGYAAVRGPTHPPFTEVPTLRQADLVWASDQGPEQAWYTCSTNETFIAGVPAVLGECHCLVQECHGEMILLLGSDLPRQAQLRQHSVACTSAELAQEFRRYWAPVWQRDQEMQDDLSAWGDVRQSLLGRPSCHWCNLTFFL